MLVVPVKGFKGYWVSDEGHVHKETNSGALKRVRECINHGGYIIVTLRKNGKGYSRRVHVLVWTSFIGAVPRGYQINHDTGLKRINCLYELSLMTQVENLKHSRETGLRQKPKFETKIDDIQVITLYTCKKTHRRKDLVKYTGTSIRNVEMILSGQSRKKLYAIIHE